ncbi:MAG: right-handed parallel beta-helix repeat-containing protein, partial [Candidatus Cloacimonetes bacterium]|nr:right-handed parallel beta-helix repeat-containing protein [Candidatus Cloacimonadota bacterium]
MKTYITLLFAFILCSALSALDVSGEQSGTWSPENNPYILVGDVSVPAGSTLSIEPGVLVQAMGNFRINAEGSIQAIGTETDSIRFENAQNPPTELWKGIRLENETEQSNFMHIVVEYAEYGINAVDSPMEVSYSRFSYNQRGLHLYGIGNSNPAPMNVHHNIIEHTMQNGILVPQNSNAWIHHNEVRYNGTVTQYYGAIQLANQSTGGQNNPIIEYNYIHDNFKQGI